MGTIGSITGLIQAERPVTTVALVAHDGKKDDLLRLVRRYSDNLGGFRFVATASTGTRLMMELGLDVDLVESGPNGGDLQIGARIVEGAIDAVVFLRDPLTAHPHEPDIQALMKACDVHDVPLATNLGSAEMLLQFLAEGRPPTLPTARTKRFRVRG